MENTLSKARERAGLYAQPQGNINAFVVAALAEHRVLRVLSAGWATPQDFAYLVSFLAWTQSVVIDGAHASLAHVGDAKDAVHRILEIGDKQSRRYDDVLAGISAQRLTEKALPSFAKYFRDRCSGLSISDEPGAAIAFGRIGVSISSHILDAVQRSLKKADFLITKVESSERQESSLVESDDMNAVTELAAMDQKVVESALILYQEFLDDLWNSLTTSTLQCVLIACTSCLTGFRRGLVWR